MTHSQKLFQSIILIGIAILISISGVQIAAQESEDVSVSATVPAHPDDYQLAITADPRDSRQSQGAQIHYTITYGSNLSYTTTPFILEATILPGQILGITVPSLYIADYVSGSASYGYSATAPVVDLIAHTITWTIPSLPAQTIDQTISFTLKTNTSYTGSEVVDFNVTVKAIAPDITINDVMQQSYLYREPASRATPSPTPTPIIETPVIQSIQSKEITNTSATFFLVTEKPTTIKASVTSQPKKSVRTITDPTLSRYHTITISDLEPDTSYTIIITASDAQGLSVKSSALTIHTNLRHQPIKIDTSSLMLTSLDSIFLPESEPSTGSASALATLPINTPYTFQLRIKDSLRIVRVQGVIQNAKVLGLTTDNFSNDASTEMVDMEELHPSIYIGTLKTKPVSGLYDLRLRITDTDGNITEHPIGKLSVVLPFTVLRKDTHAPFFGARIFLSRYNAKQGVFKPIIPSFFHIQNPSFTNERGESSFTLPQGTYKAEVTYLGAVESVVFNIDNKIHTNFPVVYITIEPLTAIGYIKNSIQIFLDIIVKNTIIYGAALGSSSQLFELLSISTFIILFIMTLLAFSSRTFIPLTSLPRYVLHAIHSVTRLPASAIYISGTVIDGESRKPISLCDVSIIDITTNTIATVLKTDKSGHYFFRLDPKKTYEIEIRKSNYERVEAISFQPDLSPYRLAHVLHAHHMHKKHGAFSSATHLAQTVLSACLEALIILTFILDVLFIRYFGLSATFPYVLASSFTVLLWIAYMHHKNSIHTPN